MAGRKIGARHRATGAIEIGGDLAPDIAAIEIVETGMRKMIERRSKRRLFEGLPDLRRLAVAQEHLCEARHILELGELLGRELRLAAGDDIAFRAGADRGRQEFGQRNASTMHLGGFEGQHPARNRARHGECRERTARRDRFIFAIEVRTSVGAGAARRHHGSHAAGRLARSQKPSPR